jgi:phage terminase small subunit
MSDLTPKMLKFATHLFQGKTQADAYRLSYDAGEMTDASIYVEARKLAERPAIVAKVEEMKRDAEFVAELSVAWVLKQYMKIAVADPNELIESRRVNCRHCHGKGHAYQWRDAMEWANDVARVIAHNNAVELANGRAKSPQPLLDIPSDVGGYGFNAMAEPVASCPHCDGVGYQHTHIHDSRKAKSPLYMGIKQTKDGVQVLMRDQDGALGWLAKYVGIDKKEISLTGPGGGPLKSISAVTNDPAEASKLYAELISASTVPPAQ